MILTINQKQVLEGINGRLVRGDIKAIAASTNLHWVTVSRALSVNKESYDEDIVQAALIRIAARDQGTQNSLAQLNAN